MQEGNSCAAHADEAAGGSAPANARAAAACLSRASRSSRRKICDAHGGGGYEEPAVASRETAQHGGRVESTPHTATPCAHSAHTAATTDPGIKRRQRGRTDQIVKESEWETGIEAEKGRECIRE